MKQLFISIITIALGLNAQAQSVTDAIRFNQRQYTGTARSLSMANAFGSLGGDATAIAINPASIAVYRSNEFAFTPSINYNSSTSNYGENSMKEDVYRMQLNQVGFVTNYAPLREVKKGVVSTSFGIHYNKTGNFNENIKIGLRENTPMGQTYLDRAADYSSQVDDLGNPVFPDPEEDLPDLEWALYNSELLNVDNESASNYYNAYESVFEDGTEYIESRNDGGINQQQILESSGNSGEYGVSYGVNFSNTFMVGGSINLATYKYTMYSAFREINSQGLYQPSDLDIDYYDIYTHLNQRGTGVNIKIGTIVNLNPIRLSVSVASPTVYSIKENYEDEVEAHFLDGYKLKSTIGDKYTYNYTYRSPYQLQLGGAYILGKKALVSVDYSMTDHTFSKFSADKYDRYIDNTNEDIQEHLQVAHNLRIGAEIKPIPLIALRCGAAYNGSEIKKEYNGIANSSMMYTGGVGFRMKSFFLDVAYALTQYERGYNIYNDYISFQQATINNNNHLIAFTFGWKL